MNWRTALPRVALVLLALTASFGVYQYSAIYMPWWFALISAAAYETTYVGLAVARTFDATQQRRARAISGGAVVTSVIYNTLAGLFHRVPLEAFALPVYGELAFAALHGVPLAWVAYLVADLIHHTAPTERSTPPAAVAPQSEVTVADSGPAPAALPAPGDDSTVTVAPLSKSARVKALAARRGWSESKTWRLVKKGEVEV